METKKIIEDFVSYIDDPQLVAKKTRFFNLQLDMSVFRRCFAFDLDIPKDNEDLFFQDATLSIVNYKPISTVHFQNGFPIFANLRRVSKLPPRVIIQSGVLHKLSMTFNQKDIGVSNKNIMSMRSSFLSERDGRFYTLKKRDCCFGEGSFGKDLIEHRMKFGNPLEEDDHNTRNAYLLSGLALTNRYHAEMEIEISNGTSVSIPMNLSQIREVLSDRDKKETGSRRPALIHLVSKHSRKISEEDMILVREHLRGKIECKWRGFDIKLHPSQFDCDRLQKQTAPTKPNR